MRNKWQDTIDLKVLLTAYPRDKRSIARLSFVSTNKGNKLNVAKVVVILLAVLIVVESMNLIWFASLATKFEGWPFNWRLILGPSSYLKWIQKWDNEQAALEVQEMEESSETSDY